MVKGIIGSVFILASAILYSTKYLSAALISVNSGSWGEDRFIQALTYTPDIFNLFIYLSFGAGILLILWYISEINQKAEKESDSIDD
ncbi:hypothetical protein AB4027_01825 [Alkalibacterium putridalgicola]|jgi:hypothetical protein|uniref:Uncharacterized protein n=1 Tax=Alkalibacterium putridalgicola TaxID=426703 RepID=A0A1H7TVJ3_9LACT|nr:hypothetical protein [Alkalibacterium putridalgicola]GEK88603.1 hypothetical protein APU01nite_06420 [Alkalibacterium putridalgicola]SEL88539.1 hypothetical protein SAMN04488100_11430 [Alkalibacterium putridalgicola]